MALGITNTTVFIGWDATVLPPECNDVVFSFATLTFGVDVELGMDTIQGFPQVCIHCVVVSHYYTLIISKTSRELVVATCISGESY